VPYTSNITRKRARIPVRIGIHLSTGKSLAAAAMKAEELGASTFQIFSASPRMWRAVPPSPEDIFRLKELRAQYDLTPLVIHDNYLINLAAANETVRRMSIVSFRGEVMRALAIGADYLVAHPGSWRDQSLESSIEIFAHSLAAATEGLDTTGLTLLLECTAGQGCTLGRTFEELAALRDAAAPRTALRIAFCLDTCHLFAAGYNITTPDGLDETLSRAGVLLGLDNIPVIHTNDSKMPFGSFRDRHENIGKGHIGNETFRRLLTHPLLAGKAFILETPVDKEGDDLRNIRTLRRLASSSTKRPPDAPR
jgi:deoxyribonuclease-4